MNEVTIYGDEGELEKFVTKEGSEDDNGVFSMQRHLPCPDDLRRAAASMWSPDDPVTWQVHLDDPDNKNWTQEVYDRRVAEWKKLGKTYRKNRDAHGYNNWYDWQIAKWGTKWDVDCYEDKWRRIEHRTPDENVPHLTYKAAVLGFNTAWSPPEAFFYTISKTNPTLYFELSYAEGGMDFAGTTLYHDGRSVTLKAGTYVDLAVELGFEDEGFMDDWDE